MKDRANLSEAGRVRQLRHPTICRCTKAALDSYNRLRHKSILSLKDAQQGGNTVKKIALGLVGLIAALHAYIAWFEIFAWTSRGPNIFDTLPTELFAQTTQLAANQGIYNAFLAVGLIWSLLIKDQKWQFNIAVCFLGFVAAAGVMAAFTIAFTSGLPQFVPASIALVLLIVSRTKADS